MDCGRLQHEVLLGCNSLGFGCISLLRLQLHSAPTSGRETSSFAVGTPSTSTLRTSVVEFTNILIMLVYLIPPATEQVFYKEIPSLDQDASHVACGVASSPCWHRDAPQMLPAGSQ